MTTLTNKENKLYFKQKACYIWGGGGGGGLVPMMIKVLHSMKNTIKYVITVFILENIGALKDFKMVNLKTVSLICNAIPLNI